MKSVESYEVFYSKRYQDDALCSFAYKLVCVDDEFTKPIVVFKGENAAYKFIEAILKEHQYCKKVMRKHFHKNLIMSEKEEEQLQSSNICSTSEKLIDDDDEKVRDQFHVTGKFRGAAHWSCNTQLTKKAPDSHLIFDELNKFDTKIDVIPNRLEKYMAFFLNKILVLLTVCNLSILASKS